MHKSVVRLIASPDRYCMLAPLGCALVDFRLQQGGKMKIIGAVFIAGALFMSIGYARPSQVSASTHELSTAQAAVKQSASPSGPPASLGRVIEHNQPELAARTTVGSDPVIRGSYSFANELTASDSATNNAFGWSVALSSDGSTALVGSEWDGGAAYIFTRRGSTTAQMTKLTESDRVAGDQFGSSVALSADGSTALVGGGCQPTSSPRSCGPGRVLVFTRNGSTYAQTAELTATPGTAGDNFGFSVALSGDGSRALIGTACPINPVCAAFVFTRSGSTYTQTAELTASDGGELSVALSAADALVGAPWAGGSCNGAAYVFSPSGSGPHVLTPSNGNAGDCFGLLSRAGRFQGWV
jgi:FG-GAP repeat